MEKKLFLKLWRYAVPLSAFALVVSCSEDTRNPVGPDLTPSNQGIITNQIGDDIRTPGDYTINTGRWTALYTLKVGTGVIDPFLSVQADSVESGFNTDASPLPLDDTRQNFTDKLPLNNVPIFIENGTLWREFIFEANESNGGTSANFSVERFDMYVCHDPNAPTYSALTDFTANQLCTKVYDIAGTVGPVDSVSDHTSLRATDASTQGSGNDLDYRILIPAARFGAPANGACPYNPTGADCGYYLVLHVNIGGLGGIWKTGSTFEEFSTVKRAVPPILRVVKRVVNDNGGTADYTAFNLGTSAGTLVFGAGVADGANTLKYTAAPLQVDSGTYTLTEADVAGYTEGAWSCVGNAGPVTTTFNAGSVNLRPGEDVTCTITNNDIAPQLSLVKEVVNDNGGTANASAWTLTATGTSGGFSGVGSPATGSPATNGPHGVTAGVQYTLSESGGPTGYTAAAVWVCTGGGTFVSPDKITLAVGETASCKIVNDDNPPQLSLVKEVVNDNGGTANASAWTLTATGTGGFSGAGTPATGSPATNGPNVVQAGVQYTLSESGGPAGYTAASAWVCTGTGGTFVSPDKITLALGASVSCKIVNNDNAPQLTLVKEVVNDNGGTANASAWTLTATGSGGFSGTGLPATGSPASLGPNNVTAGVQYTLSESGPTGYTAAAAWVCTGTGGTFVSPDKITLALGANVSCKMVNNDNVPKLSLVKEVVNDNGGTANASAWTLTATGSGGFSGAGTPASGSTATNGPNNVTAGVQYTLSESGGPAGYTAASAWVCTGTGGTFVSPDKITVALGGDVSCKIVNNDIGPELSLVKEVINDNGGTANASAWTLTATGTGGFSGVGTPATGTTATNGPHGVQAGVQYTLSESGGPAGYTAAAAWVCTGTGGTFVSPDKITLALGGSVSCKIVNDDNVPKLSLVKEVVNDNGGTANASAWTLTATGSGGFSGAGTPATGTTATNGPNNVTAGVQYTLSESGGPSGYTAAAAWVCTGTGGTFVSPDKITVALGGDVSCKIVNNDNPPKLTLVKEVVNNNGGTANASAWTLTATGSGGFSGTGLPATGSPASLGPNTVTAGVEYTLSESGGPAGYSAAAAWVCTGTGGSFTSPDKITVALGGDVSCKIVNDDIAPKLSLVKEVVNDNGGTANASAWTLTATGSGGFSGVGSPATGSTATKGPLAVTAGIQYTLSESGGPTGYTAAAAWVCTGTGGTFTTPDKIQLALADSVSCKMVNNDRPAVLIVKKILKGNAATFAFTGSGDANILANFNLSPATDGVDSVKFSNLSVGTKTITEIFTSGYVLTDLGCTNTAPYDPANPPTVSPTLALGDSVTCTFINEEVVGQTTRTQGFWATHMSLTNAVWFGGTVGGHTFAGIADKTLCAKSIDTIGKLLGGFWSGVSQTSTKGKRSALDQARMRLLQQLLAAELNHEAFGSSPSGTTLAQAEAAYCGTDITVINNAASAMGAFNESGDNGVFTPGVSANGKTAKDAANIPFWDILP